MTHIIDSDIRPGQEIQGDSCVLPCGAEIGIGLTSCPELKDVDPHAVSVDLATHLANNATVLRLLAEQAQTPEAAITSIFNGSGQTRIGRSLSPDSQEFMECKLKGIMEGGMPIPIATNWGPRIHYASLGDQAATLADLSALNMLVSVDAAVSDVYEPGIEFTIFIEDTTGKIVEGDALPNSTPVHEFEDYVERYASQLEELVDSFGGGVIRTVRESKLLEGVDWKSQCLENFDAFCQYLADSEAAGIIPEDEHSEDARYQDLESFKRLQALGWNGPIPQNMRDYYLGRIGFLAGDIDQQASREMMARMFSAILFHVQDRTFGRKDMFDIDPIRHSFVGAVPGAPTAVTRNRFYTKSTYGKKTPTAPSWASRAVLRTKGGVWMPKFISHRDTSLDSCLHPAEISVRNGDNGVSLVTEVKV